jgi:DNA-binding PadR family transcriptional regulator
MNAMNPAWDPNALFAMGQQFADQFGRGRRGRPPFGPRHGGPRPDMRADSDTTPPERPEGDERGPGRRGRRHGGPRFGPGFGPGGPGFGPGGPGRGFGPGGPGGFGPGGPRGGGRRGRRTNRGDVRLAVLALVAEAPRHGYEIIQEIAERSGGRWKPSPGSVYPTLSQLEDEGLVRLEQTDGRRVVHLTEAGTAYVAEHRDELDKVWQSMDADGEENEPTGVLWQQLGLLHAAAQQVIATGTPEQVAAATEALTEARKTIYRLLAE